LITGNPRNVAGERVAISFLRPFLFATRGRKYGERLAVQAGESGAWVESNYPRGTLEDGVRFHICVNYSLQLISRAISLKAVAMAPGSSGVGSRSMMRVGLRLEMPNR